VRVMNGRDPNDAAMRRADGPVYEVLHSSVVGHVGSNLALPNLSLPTFGSQKIWTLNMP